MRATVFFISLIWPGLFGVVPVATWALSLMSSFRSSSLFFFRSSSLLWRSSLIFTGFLLLRSPFFYILFLLGFLSFWIFFIFGSFFLFLLGDGLLLLPQGNAVGKLDVGRHDGHFHADRAAF